MKRLLSLLIVTFLLLIDDSNGRVAHAKPSGDAVGTSHCEKSPKKKKTRRKRKSRRRRGGSRLSSARSTLTKKVRPLPEVSAVQAALLFAKEPAAIVPSRVENAESRIVGERDVSKVTPETTSRWSNRGAMEPIESVVSLQAELPERNRPRPIGVETPGQRLVGGEDDRISARVAVSAYRLTTNGQDVAYDDQLENGQLVPIGDRDIELLRARATLTYERIRGSQFSTHFDLEVRPRFNGDGRFGTQRLNAAYVAWGRTDRRPSRGRRKQPSFGVALGRVAVREAGYAQADGLLLRWLPASWLDVGVFGGVTGNPYGFNWALQTSETFSADWMTGGGFLSFQRRNFQMSVAGVLTLTTIQAPEGSDRIYVRADAAWQPLSNLSLFVNGFVDVLPSGQTLQNGELVAAWTPGAFNLSLGLGRFSTVSYEVSTGYSFLVDPLRNTYEGQDIPLVDENGNAIVPFDAARLTAIYNQARLAVGYHLTDVFELYSRVNLLIRDVSLAQEQSEEVLIGTVQLAPTVDFAPLRLLPAVGFRFRNPKLFDANAQATLIVDDQAQSDAMMQVGLGKEIRGFYLRVDGRYIIGDIDGIEAGASVIYRIPSSWTLGRVQIRGSFRYYLDDVAVERPAALDQTGALLPDDVRDVISVQESYLGFAGIEWRL